MTDPPESLPDLVVQRRRWYNGSLFASFHVLLYMLKIWHRDNIFQNLKLTIFYVFMIFQNLFSFCAFGCFYAAYSIFLREAFPSSLCSHVVVVANILENVYILCLLLLLFLCTTIDVSNAKTEFWIASGIFCMFSLLMIGCSIYYAFGSAITLITVSIFLLYLLTFMIPIGCNICRFKLGTMIRGLLYGILMSPTYIIIFPIYSISNIHNIQWGTRATQEFDIEFEAKRELKYKNFRFKFLLIWIIINTIVAAIINYLKRTGQVYFLLLITIFFSIFTVIKLVFSVCHIVIDSVCRLKRWCCKKRRSSKNNAYSQFNYDYKEWIDKFKMEDKDTLCVMLCEDEDKKIKNDIDKKFEKEAKELLEKDQFGKQRKCCRSKKSNKISIESTISGMPSAQVQDEGSDEESKHQIVSSEIEEEEEEEKLPPVTAAGQVTNFATIPTMRDIQNNKRYVHQIGFRDTDEEQQDEEQQVDQQYTHKLY